MTKRVEIFFADLKPEAQQRLLEKLETTEDRENWKTVPLAVIEKEIDDPYP